MDLEDKVDAVLGKLDDLGIDAGRKVPVTAIEIEDAPHVAEHPGAGIDLTGPLFDLGGELLVGERMIALEGDAIDDRVFDDLDDEGVADALQFNVGEEAGGEQRLQRLVDQLLVPRLALLDQQERTVSGEMRRVPSTSMLRTVSPVAWPGGAPGAAASAGNAVNPNSIAPTAAHPGMVDSFRSKTPTPGPRNLHLDFTPLHPGSCQLIRPLTKAMIRRWTRSFQVANTINVSTKASPIRKPYS